MPIVKLSADESEQIINPFFENKNIEGQSISYSNKLLPILSSYVGAEGHDTKYGDLIIPDIHSYVIANNIQEGNVSFIDSYRTTSEHEIVLFSNNDGYGLDNIRKTINDKADYFKSLFSEEGREMLDIIKVSSEFVTHNTFIENILTCKMS